MIPPSRLTPHKRIVTAFYQELWSNADTSLVAGLMHQDVSYRGALGPPVIGHADMAFFVAHLASTLEGMACAIAHIVEEGDRVAVRVGFTGIHRGILLGFGPTGERLAWEGSAHFTFRDGLISDIWELSDVHGLIRQLQRHASGIARA